MGGICTFLPCIVAVFVLKEVLTYPEIRATANNPLICTVFLVGAHYPLRLTNYIFENKVHGDVVLPMTLTAKPCAATKPLAWPLALAVICWVSAFL